MVQKIIDIVFYHSQEDLILDEEEASAILTDLEEAGMLPPFNENNTDQASKRDTDGYTWEDEDET